MPECSIHPITGFGAHLQSTTPANLRGATGADEIPIHGRIFHFGKVDGSPELNSVLQLCATSVLSAISDEYVAYISDETHLFNTAFVIGSDPVRIRRFFRFYRPLFLPKAKIAVLKDGRPKSRAQLLINGFDDVFDVGMEHREQRARLASIHNRMATASSASLLHHARQTHLLFYVDEPLNNREARILSMLVAGQGRPVRLHQLTASARSPLRTLSHKSLRVLISGLRSKLKPAFCITGLGDAGYAFARKNVFDVRERKLG